MQSIRQDLRYGIRQLRRSPAHTLLAVLILALGAGANALMFSVIDSVLLRPLPYPHARALVDLKTLNPTGEAGSVSLPNFEDWRAQSHSFSAMAAYNLQSSSLRPPNAEPLRVDSIETTANLFDVLGTRPLLGRAFLPGEDKPGKPCVLVLSAKIWADSFGGDAGMIGKTADLNGKPCTIVGVMPRGFSFPQDTDSGMWTTLHPALDLVHQRGVSFLNVIARLRPGTTLSAARSESATIAQRLASTYPAEDKGRRIEATLYQDLVTGDVSMALWALLGAVGVLLLITCANVANLQLTRAVARKREMAIRAALGGGRLRIGRQLFTESLLLALAGTGAGLALAYESLGIIKGLAANILPRANEIELHGEVCLALFGVAGFTAVLFGLAPILQTVRQDIEAALRQTATAAGGSRRAQWLRDLLVVGQLGLAVVLLATSGLLLRTLYHLLQEDRGFNARNVLTLTTNITENAYKGRDLATAVYEPELDRIRRLPGVQSAGVVTFLPLGHGSSSFSFVLLGQPSPDPQNPPHAALNAASDGYFRALQIPLVRGRSFNGKDTSTTPRVAVINDVLARRYLNGQNPIGHQIAFDDPDLIAHPLTIVGVVRGSRQHALAQPPDPEIYLCYRQIPPDTLWSKFLLRTIMVFAIRTDGDPTALARGVQSEIHQVNSNQTLFFIETMDNVVAHSVQNRQLILVLLGVFAGLALLVAAAGLYAVLSYGVQQRTRDIAVRMALGARLGDVLGLIVGRASVLYALGLAFGLAGAIISGQLVAKMLVGVQAWDPLTLGASGIVLILVSFPAAWFPARRAASVDPMTALRME
jgi:predicted permease